MGRLPMRVHRQSVRISQAPIIFSRSMRSAVTFNYYETIMSRNTLHALNYTVGVFNKKKQLLLVCVCKKKNVRVILSMYVTIYQDSPRSIGLLKMTINCRLHLLIFGNNFTTESFLQLSKEIIIEGVKSGKQSE